MKCFNCKWWRKNHYFRNEIPSYSVCDNQRFVNSTICPDTIKVDFLWTTPVFYQDWQEFWVHPFRGKEMNNRTHLNGEVWIFNGRHLTWTPPEGRFHNWIRRYCHIKIVKFFYTNLRPLLAGNNGSHHLPYVEYWFKSQNKADVYAFTGENI